MPASQLYHQPFHRVPGQSFPGCKGPKQCHAWYVHAPNVGLSQNSFEMSPLIFCVSQNLLLYLNGSFTSSPLATVRNPRPAAFSSNVKLQTIFSLHAKNSRPECPLVVSFVSGLFLLSDGTGAGGSWPWFCRICLTFR